MFSGGRVLDGPRFPQVPLFCRSWRFSSFAFCRVGRCPFEGRIGRPLAFGRICYRRGALLVFWRDRCKPANPSSISRAKQNTPAIERPPAESPKRCRPAVAWLRLGPGKLPGPSLYSPTALEPMAPQPCPRLADKILTGFAKNTLSFCSCFVFATVIRF